MRPASSESCGSFVFLASRFHINTNLATGFVFIEPAPHSTVDVGSFTGEFLEAFMQRFPASHGQWTEPVTGNGDNAKARLTRFGAHVDYVIGCPGRDIGQGCLPKDMDVLITSWLSIHQNLAGIRRFYKQAAANLPSGGWLVNLDHVSYGQSPWARRMPGAREELASSGINAITEGPRWATSRSPPTCFRHLHRTGPAPARFRPYAWRATS
jgi:hypothetical protein